MLLQFKKNIGTWLLTAFCCWLAWSPTLAKSGLIEETSINFEVRPGNLSQQDSLGLITLTEKDSSKSKVIAAVLAFPLGIFGLHRMYLGAKPIIPILYIVTLGGGLGILPFTDMMVIILSKDTKPFYKNSKILMWYKKGKKDEPIPQ